MDLLSKMLVKAPNKRITIQEIADHPFLQEIPEKEEPTMLLSELDKMLDFDKENLRNNSN